jgi:hypothetical protein
MLEWLEGSGFSSWVGQSVYAYPTLLTLHALGLAVVVGTLAMFNLRILGFLPGLSFSAFKGLMKLVWAGFAVNLASGTALFVAGATSFASNRQFLIKITAVCLAMVVAGILHYRLTRHDHEWIARAAPAGAKLLAAVSLSLWFVAIAAGRLIAYTDRLFAAA